MRAWKSLPCFITWEIWLGLNRNIFENKHVYALSFCFKGLADFNECPEGKLLGVKPSKAVLQLDLILYDKPVGFFYGSSIQNSLSCVVGAMLFLNPYCYCKLWMCSGSGSNTMGEILSLWLLLHFISSIGLDGVHVFGDSKVIVD